MLQCVAVCCSVFEFADSMRGCPLHSCACVAVCVLQRVAVCCNVLQCVAVCLFFTSGAAWQSLDPRPTVLQIVAVCCRVLQYITECCSMLQYVAVCCSMLQYVAVLLNLQPSA